ncbi:ATPase [Geomonas silvestris]|uniref:ATPase n=1 Tax=Geomonas silvestris TaxID=2740184 RepID=A0A6V8MCQ3_9BACT|nr:XrtA/PEP-CTERM system-associated ATPase [Geomonas silvestris]GFO57780.1 ATPase [Geomonas silvestris]
MYEAYFNLRKKPFELVPDPDFIYLSRAHKKALTYLDYGIRERAGFILLTGDVGSGKTTLIRNLLAKRYERVTVSKIFNTRVTSEQLLAMINDDFGLDVAGKDKITLIRELNDFLLEQHALGKHPILIIDEAQNLAADLLEEVRMLSNLESSHSKLLQIVLVGQPELRETLAAPELMQLRQRISINCHLKGLSRQEMADYIVHRLKVAGNAEALAFSSGALDVVYQYSRGIPRLVNIICDFLMLSAFAEEVAAVSPEMAHDVVGDLDFEHHFWGGAQTPAQVEVAAGALEQTVGLDPATAQQLLATLGQLSDGMAALREEFGARLERNEQAFTKLDLTVTSLGLGLQRLEKRTTPPAAEPGLMRRLFGPAAGGEK